MADSSTYNIVVRVDPSQAQQGLGQVHQSLGGIESLLVSIGEAVGLAELGHQALDLVESYDKLQNRLRNLVDSDRELRDVTESLFVVAEQTRGSFNATADVFAKLDRASQGTGTSQAQLLQITKALNEESVIQGRTSEDLTGIVGQLSIALQSGTLNARALRLILRDFPDVADAIAKSLGTSTEGLKKLGQEGKITGDQLFTALTQAADVIDAKFAKTVPTVSQAFTNLQTAFQKFLSSENDSLGATEKFAQLVQLAADHVNLLAGAIAALAVLMAGQLATKALPLVIGGIETLSATAVGATGALTIFGTSMAAVIGTAALYGAAAVALGELIGYFADQQRKANEAINGTAALAAQNPYQQIGAQIDFLNAKITKYKEAFSANPDDTRAKALLEAYTAQLVEATRRQEDLDAAKKKQHETDQQILNETRNLDDQLRVLQYGTKEREVQTKLLETQNKLQAQGIALTPDQSKEIADRLRNIQTLTDEEKALESIRGPQEEYERRVRLVTAALVLGIATGEEYDRTLRSGGIPEITAKLNDETSALGSNAKARELLTTLHEAADKVGRRLTAGEVEAVTIAVQRKQVAEEQAKVLQEIQGPQQAYADKVAALNVLLEKGKITAHEYNQALSGQEQGPRVPEEERGANEKVKIDTGPLSDKLALMTEELDLLKLSDVERQKQVALEQAAQQLGRSLTADEVAQITQLVEKKDDLISRLKLEADARNQAIATQHQLYVQLNGDQEKAAADQAALNNLYRAGAISAEQYARGLVQIDLAARQADKTVSGGFARGIDQLKLQLDDVGSSVQTLVVDAFNQGADAIVKFANGGSRAFADFAQSILQQLEKLAAQQLLGQLLGLGLSAIGGAAIPAGEPGFPGRAEGGDVIGRKPYIIGEKGPELFVPKNAGTILPNSQLKTALTSSAPNVNVAPPQVNVKVSNSLDSRDVVRSGLQTREGEQEVLNIIQRNRTSLKRTLA